MAALSSRDAQETRARAQRERNKQTDAPRGREAPPKGRMDMEEEGEASLLMFSREFLCVLTGFGKKSHNAKFRVSDRF